MGNAGRSRGLAVDVARVSSLSVEVEGFDRQCPCYVSSFAGLFNFGVSDIKLKSMVQLRTAVTVTPARIGSPVAPVNIVPITPMSSPHPPVVCSYPLTPSRPEFLFFVSLFRHPALTSSAW